MNSAKSNRLEFGRGPRSLVDATVKVEQVKLSRNSSQVRHLGHAASINVTRGEDKTAIHTKMLDSYCN